MQYVRTDYVTTHVFRGVFLEIVNINLIVLILQGDRSLRIKRSNYVAILDWRPLLGFMAGL
jgi:hypothetical protein